MNNTGKWIVGIIGVFFGLSFLFLGFVVLSFMTTVSSTTSEQYEEVTGSGSSTDRVAVVEIDDVITDAEETIRQLRKYQNRSNVKAIVLRLNSPGGAVAPSQEIFQEVKRTTELGKPVVASMSSVAASGAYYIACGATTIVANPGTITGSIGVISEFVNFKGLLDKIGVESTTIKSGAYKDVGNPARRMSAEELRQMQSVIDDVYQQFVGDVSASRHIPADSVRVLADGRVYTGRQAYANGLVDTLGTFQTAIRVAGVLGRIEGEPKVLRERNRPTLVERFFAEAATGAVHEVRKRVESCTPLEYRMSY